MAVEMFPPVDFANEEGLLAIGGNLEIETLLTAYKKGIFPWPIDELSPLAWFSPSPRGIIRFCDLSISSSMKKLLKKNTFHFRLNNNFERVIKECAISPNRKEFNNSTWINNQIIDAYINLHYEGYAYSAEAYDEDDQLVGGLYGVTIDKFVSGESMFYKKSNASKFALIQLLIMLNSIGIDWLDTQMTTPVVKQLGGIEVPREEFINLLDASIQTTTKNTLLNKK